jgi:hypothetical protein
MPRLILTDGQERAILDSPAGESTAALARRIGAPYPATYRLRSLIQRGQWSCALTMRTCDTCGQPLLIPPQSHGQRRHRACVTERNRQRQQQLRHGNECFRAEIYERARKRQDELQEATRNLDHASYRRWTPDDDAYLWEHRADVYAIDGAVRVARALGRSHHACQRRLTRLIEQRQHSDTLSQNKTPPSRDCS